MTTTVDQGRGLLGFLSPLCGTRSTGKVLVVPPAGTSGSVVLSPNWWLSPVIDGGIRPEFAYRVLPNYAAESPFAWEIPPSGALVDVEAHVGGDRYDLPAGTILRWADFVPEGLDESTDGVEVSADYPITGGANVPELGSDRLVAVSFYEQLGQAQIALDLFRSNVGAFPAAILVWDSGSTDATFTGRGRQGYKERYNLLLVCDRADSDPKRRGEGLRLLDLAHDLLLWRQVYGDEEQKGGGIIVSAIHHTNVVGRFRLPTTKDWQQFYIYGLRIEATRIAQSVYSSNAKPWRKTRVQAQTPETNFPTDPNVKDIVDESFKMPQKP